MKNLSYFFVVLCLLLLSKAEFGKNNPGDNLPVLNSIVIFIHGDGDYLFYTKDGKALNSDQLVLDKAKSSAEKLVNSEVFIFHQKKKEYSMFVFAKNDLDLYYYKNGELKEQESLSKANFQFAEEINFYKKYKAESLKRIVLYYGHEIPVDDGFGYNISYNNSQFNLGIFSDALDKLSGNKKLDLLVLSTSYNGSPEVIKNLSGKTDYIVASPEDLHLYYMNPSYLKKLNYYKNPGDFENFVVDLAESAYNDLKWKVETGCTVAAYKTSQLSPLFLKSVKYEKSLAGNPENCDCAELKNFDTKEAKQGVIVFHNPPASGHDQYKMEHSGWGCSKETQFEPESIIDDFIGGQQPDQSEASKSRK